MKQRLDDWLIEQGLAADRRQALALLLSGRVKVGNHQVTQPGTLVSRSAEVQVDSLPQFVSRGGLKLDPILRAWQIVVQDRVCLDIGASTGGFTDCLLQQGARLVYALDVGKGLLDWRLRNHPQVWMLEETNARHLTPDLFSQLPTLVTIDVSFISVNLILAPLLSLSPIEVVALIKPQFEARREQVPPGGVIRDPAVRGEIVKRAREFALKLGFTVLAELPSPVKGQKGNREFFLHLRG